MQPSDTICSFALSMRHHRCRLQLVVPLKLRKGGRREIHSFVREHLDQYPLRAVTEILESRSEPWRCEIL